MNNNVSAVESRSLQSTRWSLRLFGGFELGRHPGDHKVALPGKRERALLAYLALSPKGRQPRRKLAALLWGDATDQTLLDNLRTCVWRLRKALGDSEHRILASDEEDIVLDLGAFDIDVLTFRDLAARTGRAELEAAAKLNHGELLEGLELDSEEFESWRRMERSRHLDQAIDLLGRLMKQSIECGKTEYAIETGTQILRLDPLHEATARHMMQLYAESGRRGAAIQLYRTLAAALHRDVDTRPGAETRRVFAGIAQTDHEDFVDPGAAGSAPKAVAQGTQTQDRPLSIAKPARSWRLSLAALTGACIAVLALGFYWRVAQPAGHDTRIAQAAVPAGPTLFVAPTPIAVLPFDNLSGDAAQQFFSDGMTEEITAALAKVGGLQLVARTSAFQFRGSKDARQVGKALGARYVIEGAVRRKEKRIRITAQLIRTDTGLSVWGDSYERDLTDIFAIQEDIATAIADALSASLGLPAGKHLISNRGIDPASYQQFLRAKPLVRARFTGVPQAIEILEPLTARNPGYAPAWALLASCYGMMPAFLSPYQIPERRQRIRTFWPKAELAAHKAIALDPNLPDAYFALARMETLRGRPVVAEDLLNKALSLDPNYPEALALQVEIFANMGLQRKALQTARRLRALEPYVPTWKEDGAEVLWESGRSAPAIEALKSLIDRPSGPTSLAMMYASEGRYADAATVLETALKRPDALPPQWPEMFRIGAALLRKAPANVVLPSTPPRLDRVGFVYLYVGAPDRALDMYEDTITSGLTGGQGNNFSYLWHASYAPVRKTERFKSFARKAGMLDYWHQRGWPDHCRPVSASDFACS